MDSIPMGASRKDRPSPAELVTRARAMFAMVRAANAQSESLRQVPDHVIEACREAGFFKILQPAQYGGYEYEPLVAYDVAMELAKASTTCGWTVGLLMMHNWEIALCDPRVAKDIWGDDPDARISSSYASFGKAEATDEGYIVNGRWPWTSGGDHAQWTVVGTRHPNAESPIGFDEKIMILKRGQDYEIDQDSWFMAGMQGSGSKDAVVHDAIVPEYRHHNITAAFFEEHRPGADVFTAKTYRYPFGVLFAWILCAIMIGSAEGAIDLYVDKMRKKISAYTGQTVKDDPYNQHRAAEAAAMVYAAKATMRACFAEMSDEIDAHGIASKDKRALFKWNACYHARAMASAVTLMIKAAGGGAFAQDQELQRFFRDTQTATNHAFLNPDASGQVYGAFMLTGQIRDFVL